MYPNNDTKSKISELLSNMSLGIEDETGEIQLNPSPLTAPEPPTQADGNTQQQGQPQQGQSTPQNHDWEKRFKDTQAALTRSQQLNKQKDAEVQALGQQLAQLSGKLDEFMSQRQQQGTPTQSPLDGVDPYEALSDPQKFNSLIDQLVERKLQDAAPQFTPDIGLDKAQAQDLLEDLQMRRELQEMVNSYPQSIEVAQDVAKVLNRYPDMTMTQAYEFLVEFGQKSSEQQNSDTQTQEPGQQNTQGQAPPTQSQGEAVPQSPTNAADMQRLAELAAKRQVEFSDAGQAGERVVRSPGDAVEMALEEMYG